MLSARISKPDNDSLCLARIVGSLIWSIVIVFAALAAPFALVGFFAWQISTTLAARGVFGVTEKCDASHRHTHRVAIKHVKRTLLLFTRFGPNRFEIRHPTRQELRRFFWPSVPPTEGRPLRINLRRAN